MPLFSLDQYFKRIHFDGVAAPPTLLTVKDIMRGQLAHVPFENLDVQAGKGISIDPDDIVKKIVERQRGGYCYEVNGLFSMALDALHIPYFFVAARPLTHGGKKPRTHMTVVVQLDDEYWLCDCGFGGHGLRAPMRLSLLNTEVNQDGELFMLSLNDEQEYVLKSFVHNHWEEQYAFNLARYSWVDFIPANHYNSTHPNSLFVQKLIVVICTPNGRKILFGNALKIIHNGQEGKRFLTQENRASILREEFGLSE